MKTHAKPLPVGLYIAALLTLLFLFAYSVSFGQGQLVMKGTILYSEDTELIPNAEIIAGDGAHMPLAIRPNGKFWVCAPTNEVYTFRFTQIGSVTKEVVVDARQACTGSECNDRKVEFDVILHGMDGDEAMRFEGPVGRIVLGDPATKPQVTHHYELLRVSSLMALEY